MIDRPDEIGIAWRAERMTPVAAAPPVRVVLTVPDLGCEHCVQTVTSALTPLDGVEEVAVDLPAKTVPLAYDPHRITLERIREVLADEAYPVAPLSGEEPHTP